MSNKRLFFGILFCFAFQISFGQYANKKVRTKHDEYTDSLKQVEYDYIFPVFGQKAYKKGFDIPYPVGGMLNYSYMKQGIVIDKIKLGVEADRGVVSPTEVEFLEFGDNTVETQSFVFRPDVWVFPFLNVYGLVGGGTSHTEIFLTSPVTFNAVVDQKGTTMGFGGVLAGGVGPIWGVFDSNLSWTKTDLLADPVRVAVSDFRIGTTLTFKSRPDRNFGVWVGALSINLATSTVGSIKISELLPEETKERATEISDNFDVWLEDQRTGIQKKVKDSQLDEFFDAIGRFGEGGTDTTINYSLSKSVKQRWNGLFGFQYQHNKMWQFRSEFGVVGNRRSLLLSLNYRFLL